MTVPQSEHFWLGRLAAAIDTALTHPEIAKPHLKTALTTFVRSDVCTPALRAHLEERKEQ